MKNKTKRIAFASVVGLSLIGTVFAIENSTIKGYAVGFGGGTQPKTIQDPDHDIPLWIQFNPKYNNNQGTPQSKYYGNKKFYREVYFPENPNLPGGFVWYSPVPRDYMNRPLSEYDMSKMYENRQTDLGQGGDYLVKDAKGLPYAYNLKYGSINPWTQSYNGTNSGSQTIKYGKFKGKKYEWRFLGYTMRGAVVGNPYFPADGGADMFKGNTRHETDNYFAQMDWIKKSWNEQYSINTFGISEYNASAQKVQWINQYFLPQHPEFRTKGNANYWAERLMPMSDPSKETGVWLGWHDVNGHPWYATFITEPPKQPNLRLIDYKIYDSQNHLIARQTRDSSDYYNNEANVSIKEPFVHKGETYRIEVDVKNMPDAKKTISGIPINLEHMYSFDSKIGDNTGYSTSIQKVQAQAPHQNRLASGEVAHFSYTYKVPTTASPKDKIQFNARIPGTFFEKGFNTNQTDDDASIILDIAPENLAVEFQGYYDMNKNPVNYVTPGYDMWVKYQVTKTSGASPVSGADLQVQLSDSLTTINHTVLNKGTYDKNGNPISDGTLKKEGDYAVFWESITPRAPKVCTQASIPSKWANKGLNSDPSDDVAKPNCLVNPDNIVVSNFYAKPKTTYVAKNQLSKKVEYTVSFDLTNFNYDKKDKDIPLVYTIDGKVVKTETVPVQSLKTMKISRILPATTVGQGQHIVQVEANPMPRKYVEFKLDSQGNEVNPYTDNIGYDNVSVQVNRDDFSCPVAHTTNYWNTTFTISTWYGSWETYPCEIHGSHTYCSKNWYYSYPTVSFYEKQEIEHVFFRSKTTTEKSGGWVDLLQQPGQIKAGYGFELKVTTRYQTNTYNDTPTPYDEGCYYGRYVSPGYSTVDSTARVKITMPFTDDTGKPIALILNGTQSGSWYNTTTTYELEERTVIDKPERKIYINENTKDGDYNVRIETEPFYGSWDKPYTNTLLCDVKNVTIEVKGSYLDDVKSHIVQ